MESIQAKTCPTILSFAYTLYKQETMKLFEVNTNNNKYIKNKMKEPKD